MQRQKGSLGIWGLIVFCIGSVATVSATSVTVQFTNGTAYALDVRSLEPASGGTTQPYVTFLAVASVLRQFDRQSRWDWDARAGLLRLAVGTQRFSFLSERAVVAVNDRLVQVALPVRFAGGEIWMPLDTLRLVISSIEGLRLLAPGEQVRVGTAAASAPIVHSPEQAIGSGLFPDGSPSGADERSTSSSLLDIPPPDVALTWKVVFDPVLIEAAGGAGESAPTIRASLAQIAERCAAILSEEGSLEPLLLTEHDEATTAELILEELSRHSPDLIVFLRFESSPLRAAPGYTIFYTDESVDSLSVEGSLTVASSATLVPRAQSYLAFQAGSRHLAQKIGAALAEVSGFRERLLLPAPLYLLKRCPARAIMIVLAFPEGSPDLARLADSGFRETLARALAGGLIAFRGERPAPASAPFQSEAVEP